MNKKRLYLAVFFYIISFIIQVTSFLIFKKVDINTFSIVAISSAIPFSISLFIISNLFAKRFKILKYIFIIYGVMALFAFIIIFIISITTGFVMNGNQFVIA